ncbi:aldo/keto reductase [Halalkalibacter alkalisediminis]|uniref:Aldo/keto reductase family oxidoreductase n=1 Tax=Halalkalibacter alkalisediminis TaxID=935616 RepID=A0ABV6NII2_9BACI|nr:aldo/keto reductase [Halalkalibacter alkalisediminis]
MKKVKVMPLEKKGITSSRLALGCMRFGGEWEKNSYTKEDILSAEKAIDTSLEVGITMFDHADIYSLGKAEKVFGEILGARPELREKMTLQSKCGIRFGNETNPYCYDFSKDYILDSVDGILSRLNTEYLDILLLHRPDPLMEPEDVAEAFEVLKKTGKVRHFGVSNMSVAQIRLLNSYCSEPMVVNQLHMSLKRIDWLEQGVLVNHESGSSVNFGDGIIEDCQSSDVQIQAWSPLAKGLYSGQIIEKPSDSDIATKELVEKLAKEKEASTEAIVLGWLMRHPAMIQPVIGTANPERIKKCQDGIKQAELMTREEWYSLYTASRGNKLP